jgi:hypothetical protein
MMDGLHRRRRTILEFTRKHPKTLNSQAIFSKRNKTGGITLPNFKI